MTLPFEPPSAGRSIVFFFHRLPYQQAPHCSQISFLLIVQYGDSRCLARGPLQALKTMRPIYIYIARVAKQMNQSRSMSCALVRPWTHLARGYPQSDPGLAWWRLAQGNASPLLEVKYSASQPHMLCLVGQSCPVLCRVEGLGLIRLHL